MSANLEQAIIEKIQALPDNKQQEVLALVDEMLKENHKLPPRENVRPIWEIITELSAQVPMEEWEKLPSDGAEQHDHYLYGASETTLASRRAYRKPHHSRRDRLGTRPSPP